MTQHESSQTGWQGPIRRTDTQDPLSLRIRRLYHLSDRFYFGGVCSIKFHCQCGIECLIEKITIKACDHMADYTAESERYFDLSYSCSCGMNYQFQTISSYRYTLIEFFEGYLLPHIYYRVDQIYR